ncbi:type IV pilus assembly protein PilM [Patescibacteria group bacterium]|nr:type IV pilus assembly protein PilM [Patescibacteria group bacterium]
MNNLLKNLFSSFNKLKDGSGDSAIGVDIGSSAIKIVEIKKRGNKAVLETYGAIALGPYADLEAGQVTNLPVEKVILALKEVLRQSDASGNSLALSIPVQSSLIFTIELPAKLGEEQIASIIPIEARKYIPVPITEVSIDYFKIPKKESSFEEMNAVTDVPKKEEEKMNVLVVTTQNDAVARYRSIVSGCNLKVSFFEIEIFSSIRSNFEHELSPVLLIDFGALHTKLSMVEFGMVQSHHTINRGGSSISDSISKSLSISFSEAEKMKKNFGLFGSPTEKSLADIIKVHIDYIFSETNNVLLEYEKKNKRIISKVILTGGGSLLKGLKEMAINNFQAEVEIGNPFSKVTAPAFLEKVLLAMGPEFAVALGLALRKLQ